jgi:hypothetical protein
MAYSITAAKSELEGRLHGTTINKITNIDRVFNRSARQLLLDIDPQETKRITQLGTIYDKVFDYSAPADLKGDGIIDIRPQQERQSYDKYQGAYSQDFDLRKRWGNSQSSFSIQFDSGTKTIRIANQNATAGAKLNTCDTLTGNGTWAVSGDASNLTIDNVDYVETSGSLKFDLASSGSQGIITNSDMTAIDLTDHENQSAIFFYVYLQTASVFTSVEIRWGSDASNYWSRTLTTDAQGNSLQNGWNLMKAEWNGATETGSPDVENVDYIQVLYNYDGTEQTGVKLDNIVSILGKIFEIEYYSKYLFRSSAGVWQETVLTDNDLINLDTETYNLFLDQLTIQAAQQQFGKDSGFDISLFRDSYANGIKRYKALYKSEKSKPRSTYYYTPRRSNYGGR